ncbi:GIY-YIG nuclease family protein [Ktedonospora formicarum]|nr:GIY-YIG nuclease family protein [Ktedonospora formicarum]
MSEDETVLGEEQTGTGHFVYIVRCADGSLYTGYARDVTRRIKAHNQGRGGHYTRSHRPVTLAAHWRFSTKREALQTEYRIKRLSRPQKLLLIEQRAPLPL